MSTKHTPGPWRWEFNESYKGISLVGGRPTFDKTVMDFRRWGMGGAQPRFMGDDDGFRILHKLSDRKDWIKPFPGRAHHVDWCASVDHPDANLIAAAPDLLDALIGFLHEFGDKSDNNANVRNARAAIAKATGEPA
jgi:hypothetical protein